MEYLRGDPLEVFEVACVEGGDHVRGQRRPQLLHAAAGAAPGRAQLEDVLAPIYVAAPAAHLVARDQAIQGLRPVTWGRCRSRRVSSACEIWLCWPMCRRNLAWVLPISAVA